MVKYSFLAQFYLPMFDKPCLVHRSYVAQESGYRQCSYILQKHIDVFYDIGRHLIIFHSPLMYMGPPQQTHYDQIFFHSRITCQLIPIKLKYGLSWYALAASMKFAHIMISELHCQVQTQIMDTLYLKLIGENLCNGFDDTLMPIGYKHYPFPSLIVVHNLVMNQVHDLSFSLTPNPNATGYTCLLASIDTATRKYICTSPCNETHQPPNWPYKI